MYTLLDSESTELFSSDSIDDVVTEFISSFVKDNFLFLTTDVFLLFNNDKRVGMLFWSQIKDQPLLVYIDNNNSNNMFFYDMYGRMMNLQVN